MASCFIGSYLLDLIKAKEPDKEPALWLAALR
jgi:hypothetical protein